jgi:hypothetical protein
VETGTGVTMNRNANVAEWLVWALAAVTGSLDRPGGVTFNPGSLRRYEDAVPGGRGDLGPRPTGRPDLRRLVNGEMPCAALAAEIDGGHVRALLVRLGNPALAIAGQPALRESLAKLEVLVAVEARPTETTGLATHVLPVADHFERGDLLAGYLQAKPFLRYVTEKQAIDTAKVWIRGGRDAEIFWASWLKLRCNIYATFWTQMTPAGQFDTKLPWTVDAPGNKMRDAILGAFDFVFHLVRVRGEGFRAFTGPDDPKYKCKRRLDFRTGLTIPDVIEDFNLASFYSTLKPTVKESA